MVTDNEMKKIRRLVAPREDGSLLVPQEIVDMWKDTRNGGREEVKKLWAQVQGDKDPLYAVSFGTSLVEMGVITFVYMYLPSNTHHCTVLSPKLWLRDLRYLQDAFISKAKKRVESIHETDLWVDGHFKSEKTMQDEGMDAYFGYCIDCVISIAKYIVGKIYIVN